MFDTRVETLIITPPMWVVLPQKKNNLCSDFNLNPQNKTTLTNYYMSQY